MSDWGAKCLLYQNAIPLKKEREYSNIRIKLIIYSNPATAADLPAHVFP